MADFSPEAVIAGFRELSSRRRRQALVIACGDALAIWRAFAAGAGRIEYWDGPGPYRVFDLELPVRALAEVERRLAGERVESSATEWAYADAIDALEQDKLELPPEAECAYFAIFDLHRLEFGNLYLGYRDDERYLMSFEAREREVLAQAAEAIDLPLDQWLRYFWTRAWDRWATDEPRYAAGMSAAAFDALAAGDPARALPALETPSLVRAIALSMCGRPTDAIDAAMDALGAGGPAVRAWIRSHLRRLAPGSIAFAPGGDRCAIIAGDRLAVLDPGGTRPRWSATLLGPARRVLLEDGGDLVWVAGEQEDEIGAAATFRHGEQLDSDEPGHRDLIEGARTIAALGGGGELVPCHEREVRILAAPTGNPLRPPADAVLGEARVAGAAFSERGDLLATHDGCTVSIWRRAGGLLAAFASAVEPVELFVGGDSVLVRCADGAARLYRIDGARIE